MGSFICYALELGHMADAVELFFHDYKVDCTKLSQERTRKRNGAYEKEIIATI